MWFIKKGSNISYIVRNLSIVSASNLIVAILAGISLALNARTLSISDFGSLALIQAFVSFIALFFAFETWLPVVRVASRKKMPLGMIVSSGAALDIMASAGATTATTIILLAMSALGYHVSGGSNWYAAVYGVSLLFSIGSTPKGYFRLLDRYDLLSYAQIGAALLNTALSALLFVFRAELYVFVATFALTNSAYNIVLFTLMARDMRGRGQPLRNPVSGRRAKRMLRIMFRIAFGNSLLSTLTNSKRQVSMLLVGALLGEAAAGVFAAASKLASMATRFAYILNQVTFPLIVSQTALLQQERLRAAMQKVTYFGIAWATVLTIIGYLAKDTLLRLAAGNDFVVASDAFVLLFAGECLVVAGVHLSGGIQAKAGPRILVMASVAATLAYFVLAVFQGLWFGVEGVAAASAVVSAAHLGFLALRYFLQVNPSGVKAT